MTDHTMPGLQSANALSRDELLQLIDRFDLKDHADDTLIAPLWSPLKSVDTLAVNCMDADPQVKPGLFLLTQLPDILLEGMLIAARILNPEKILIVLAPGLSLPDTFPPEIHAVSVLPKKALCHSAETFVALARLFRREGAVKRLCRIMGPRLQETYCEIPLTSSLTEIAAQYGITGISAAHIGGKDGYVIPSPQFDSIPRLGACPSIEFIP